MCDDELRKVFAWTRRIADRLYAERRVQEECLDFGSFVLRVAMEPHPLYPDELVVTVYQARTRGELAASTDLGRLPAGGVTLSAP